MIFGFCFIGIMTFVVIRLSISCVFWSFIESSDKQRVIKLCFPYYIIILSALCFALIIEFDKSLFAIYYFSAVYFIALLIWKYELKSIKKTNKNFAVEPNQSQLP